eukprot:CAMPEP_0119414898 /NCGR_PEP_ID=MMETSP1335-20130426/7233_1 /TAXON_ID=259385 /ORGANISM="Chrysoculter rhomboideus, Strain RCC1486" /LENGTH=485 /DNA_ID=CAMNT_0007439793 /DNA_START=18 /DNA_END=1475 /DNA_ORIENTATION=+
MATTPRVAAATLQEALVRGRAALRANQHEAGKHGGSLIVHIGHWDSPRTHLAALAGALGLRPASVWHCAHTREVIVAMSQPVGDGQAPSSRVRSSCCTLDTVHVSVGLMACAQLAAKLLEPNGELEPNGRPTDLVTKQPFHDTFFAGVAFASLEDEVSAYCVLDLLNFGSGYKSELAAMRLGQYKHGDWGSAFVVMAEGVQSAAREAPWNALRMVSWRGSDTERHFGLPEHAAGDDAPTTALAELNQLVTSALRDSGRALLDAQHSSIGAFVLAHLSGEASHTARPSASRLIDALVSLLPVFADSAVVPPGASTLRSTPVHDAGGDGGGPGGAGSSGRCAQTAAPVHVHLLKKVQLLVASLREHFSARDARFDFADLGLLTVSADPVIPAVLRAEGCLEYSPELAAAVDGHRPLEADSLEELAIRAGAVAACEAVLAVARELDGGRNVAVALDASSLDLRLWGVLGKSRMHRTAPRHIAKGTYWH